MRCGLLLLVTILLTNAASAQSIEEGMYEYAKEIQTVKMIVQDKWEELVAEARQKNDPEQAARFRQWADEFRDHGSIYMAGDESEMAAIYKAYGASLKKAGDKLRSVYVAEIRKARKKGNTQRVDNLTSQLTELRLPGTLCSIQPYKSDNFFYHFGWVCSSVPMKYVGEQMNATFEQTAGLSDPDLLSLRPCNVPSMFLCHHGFRVNIATFEENLVWKQHATWRQLPGLSDEKKGVSFQSVSHPNRYIRIRANGEAWLDTFEDTPQFRQESTFYFRPPQFQFWPE